METAQFAATSLLAQLHLPIGAANILVAKHSGHVVLRVLVDSTYWHFVSVPEEFMGYEVSAEIRPPTTAQ